MPFPMLATTPSTRRRWRSSRRLLSWRVFDAGRGRTIQHVVRARGSAVSSGVSRCWSARIASAGPVGSPASSTAPNAGAFGCPRRWGWRAAQGAAGRGTCPHRQRRPPCRLPRQSMTCLPARSATRSVASCATPAPTSRLAPRGRVAQRESTRLTSEGSEVRHLPRPPCDKPTDLHSCSCQVAVV
jgi:hypothetical protein